MRSVSLDLTFLHGKGLDDLTELLESNPRFVFTIHKRKRGKSGWTVWRHKQQKSHRGDVKLMKGNGAFHGRIKDRSDGQLTGAFLSWIVRNAHQLVYRVDFRIK